MTYQKLQIIGNLGKDPEMRYTTSGQPVTTFNVATSRSWTGNDGQRKDETTWFRVTVWGKQAETCNQYLTKGRLVLCEGRLAPQINIWTDQSGVPRAGYDMTAFEVKFLGGRDDDSGGGGGYGNQGGYSNQQSTPAPARSGYQDSSPATSSSSQSFPPSEPAHNDASIGEDEIPF
jgi:single-strand DNA-binding protein